MCSTDGTANIVMKVLIQQLLSSFVQLCNFSRVFKKDFYFPQSKGNPAKLLVHKQSSSGDKFQ